MYTGVILLLVILVGVPWPVGTKTGNVVASSDTILLYAAPVKTTNLSRKPVLRIHTHKIPMTDKILKFSSTTCGPCKQLSMILKDEDLGVPVEEVDVVQQQHLAAKYGVRAVPTMVYVRDDAEVSRFTGVMPIDKIRDWITLL